jgi:hypothetical protein
VISISEGLYGISRFIDGVIEISVSPVAVFGYNDRITGLHKFIELEIVQVASFDEQSDAISLRK